MPTAQQVHTSCVNQRTLHESPDVFAGARNATAFVMEGIGQRFVYILRSQRDPSRHYVGRTANVDERLRWHNEGPSGNTIPYRPWRILVALEFADRSTAARFERLPQVRLGVSVREAALRTNTISRCLIVRFAIVRRPPDHVPDNLCSKCLWTVRTLIRHRSVRSNQRLRGMDDWC